MHDSNDFSHIDIIDGGVSMVNISNKKETLRTAQACGYIVLKKEIINMIKNNSLIKGDVLTTAKIAGINAAKKTWELIPLCHQIKLTSIDINFKIDEDSYKIIVTSFVEGIDKTGVEMEAIMSTAISLITIYDMCKSVSKEMIISDIKLVKKTGGKSDFITASNFTIDKSCKAGKIYSINISEKKGGRKNRVENAFINEFGIVGDGHAGNWNRQVSFLSYESIINFNKEGNILAKPGDFGENITTEGVDLKKLKIGDKILISESFKGNISSINYSVDYSNENICDAISKNSVILEVTQLGKDCVKPCNIFYQVGYCIMPSEGVFCKVLKQGSIKIGDDVVILKK